MRLKNNLELETSRRKLAALLDAIAQEEKSPSSAPGYRMSIESAKRLANQIRCEIEEYEGATGLAARNVGGFDHLSEGTRLKNEQELQNTRRKLSRLLELIAKKEQFPTGSHASEISMESMKRFAAQLRAEIEEYEQAHQPSESK
jgi:hypothetical protein